MPTRNVVLTDHQTEVIDRLVTSGRYQNASEVLREGVRMVEDREKQDQARLKALRDAARVGIEDVQAGRFRDFDSGGDLREHLNKLADSVIRKAPRPRAR